MFLIGVLEDEILECVINIFIVIVVLVGVMYDL